MEEQTQAVAEPSPAPVIEVDRGPLVNLTSDQRAEFRRTGELPEPPKEQPKPEESATSTEETPNSEREEQAKPEAHPESQKKSQEQPKKARKGDLTAEERIAQLESTIEKIRKGAGIERKTEAAAVPEPKAEPQYTRPKPTAEDKDKDGNPKYSTYEDFVEDLADWKAEQRWETKQRELQQQNQQREFQSKVSDAKQRYGEKFEEVLVPTVNSIVNDKGVSEAVKQMLNESEVLPDLVFTLGSNQQELNNFLEMAKTNPGKALRYIALTESLIREELSEKAAEKETPAPPKTQAPRPPAEIGGRAATPNDALVEAAKAGDFRSFAAESTRRQLAKMKA